MKTRGLGWGTVGALVIAMHGGCGAEDGDDGNAESAASETDDPSGNPSSNPTEDPTEDPTDDPTEDPTADPTTSTGDPETDGDPTGDSSTTSEDLPPGVCDGGDHGTYACECDAGDIEDCDGGGVRTCFDINQEVLNEQRWSECGECTPGTSQACTNDAEEAGTEFCNYTDEYLYWEEQFVAPIWGPCLTEAEVVCLPGTPVVCPDEGDGQCDVDIAGVPIVVGCF